MKEFVSPPDSPHFNGLNTNEVSLLRQRHGSNHAPGDFQETWWRLFSSRFHDPVIKLLLFAAFISAVVGWYKNEYLEFIGILVTLILTVAAGFFSELKARHEFSQVAKVNEAFPTRVIRDSRTTTIPLGEVVVGDVIILDPGDEVPADGHLLSISEPFSSLSVDESALTGNPSAMSKFVGQPTNQSAGKYPPDLLLQGMVILSGHAVMEAKAVGRATEKCQIRKHSGQSSGKESLLERDLAKLGSGIGLIGLSAAAISFTISLSRGLSSGNIFLHSSEWTLLIIALASLLSGGLEIWIPFIYGSLELAGFEVTQRGLIPSSGWQNWLRGTMRFALTFFFLATLAMVADILPPNPDLWLRTASMQQLFRYLMFSLAIIIVAIPDGLGMSVTLSIAFSMKKMVLDKILVRHPYASETIGAVTTIMTGCSGPITPEAVAECRQAGIDLKIVTDMEASAIEKFAQDIGLIEQPDPESPGLSPHTPMHQTAREFLLLRPQEAAEAVKKLRILSEATPDAGQRFFHLLEEQRQRVALVGHHVADIPLLKAAEVGVALGQGGSAAVVEAGDILLMDNSLTALLSAVKWGRSLYENIQRFLVFQLTINVFAVLVELIGPAIGVDLPLTIAQMLWVNLIMDILAAMALATEPPRPGILKQSPRRTDSFIITPQMLWDITTTSLLFLISAVTILISLASDGIISREDLTFFFTVFVLLQLWNLFNARCYGRNVSVFNNLHRNPDFLMVALLILLGQFLIVQFGGALFQTVPLPFSDWWHLILGTSPVLLIHEIRRFWNEERRLRPYDIMS